MTYMVRGVRGATTVSKNNAETIIEATKELLLTMIEANGLEEEHIASVFFTTTPDLDAAYPAQAARKIGWTQTALMGMQEMNMQGGLTHCIRILVHWNTTKEIQEINHVYLHQANQLRPDLVKTRDELNGGKF